MADLSKYFSASISYQLEAANEALATCL